jgi:hypothetical protein
MVKHSMHAVMVHRGLFSGLSRPGRLETCFLFRPTTQQHVSCKRQTKKTEKVQQKRNSNNIALFLSKYNNITPKNTAATHNIMN